jgi:hypothetical protein
MLLDLISSLLISHQTELVNQPPSITSQIVECGLRKERNYCPEAVYIIIRLPADTSFKQWLRTDKPAIIYWSQNGYWVGTVTEAELYDTREEAINDIGIASSVVPNNVNYHTVVAIVELTEAIYLELMD